MSNVRSAAGYLIAFAVLAILPFVTSTFIITTLTQILCFSLLVVSVSMLMGQGGMPTLGQAAYLGVGGYAAGLMGIHVTKDVLVGLAVAVVAGLLAALITGPLVMRGRGTYMIMITLAIAQLLSQVANAWVSVTNGSDGLVGVPIQTLFGTPLDNVVIVYWLVLVVVGLVLAALGLLLASPFGHTLRGVRDNTDRMEALGYNTRLVRLAAFCVAGVASAIGGALTITQTQYMAPGEMNFLASSVALIAAIAGGVNRLWGSVVGAALVVYAQVLLPESWQGQAPLVLGLVLIVVVYFVPGGISGTVTRLLGSRKRVDGTGRADETGLEKEEQTDARTA